MIYSGKISELVKTLESVKKRDSKLSQYISLMLKRIQCVEFKSSLPKTYKYKDDLVNSIILPDGVEGSFAFNSDKVFLVITYSTITRDYATNDKTRFSISSYVAVYFRYDDKTFKSKIAMIGRVCNDEIGSPKAKYISSKARSEIARIVKMEPDAIEDFLKRLNKGR